MRIGVLQCGHETSWVNTHMFGVAITMDDAGNALWQVGRGMNKIPMVFAPDQRLNPGGNCRAVSGPRVWRPPPTSFRRSKTTYVRPILVTSRQHGPIFNPLVLAELVHSVAQLWIYDFNWDPTQYNHISPRFVGRKRSCPSDFQLDTVRIWIYGCLDATKKIRGTRKKMSNNSRYTSGRFCNPPQEGQGPKISGCLSENRAPHFPSISSSSISPSKSHFHWQNRTENPIVSRTSV